MAEHHPLGDIEYLRENHLKSYKLGFPILKELIQNAEDAGSTYFDYGWIEGISDAKHPLLRDPALFVLDNGKFTEENARAIRFILGGSSKPNQENTIGKFGLGLKSVFHLCEAFFYMSHEISNAIKPRFDIFNPWAEKDGDRYHEAWDNFSVDDCQKIKELLKPLLNREEYSAEWFILWIPLRQRTHSTQKSEEDGILLGHIKYSDDDFFGNSPPSFLHEEATKQKFALLLPLLHYLHTVRYWSRSLEREEFSISIAASSHRRYASFRELSQPHSFKGNITIISESTIEFNFSAKELILDDPTFNDILSRPNFPGKFKHIKPHIAVVLSHWRTSLEEQSTLTIRNAVFLPIGSPLASDISGESSQSYCLTLHGYFFVDFARTGILGWNAKDYTINSQKVEGDDGDSVLKKEWNSALYKKLLAEVIPEMKNLPESDIASVCQALKNSKLFINNHESICSKWRWVYQLDRKSSQWEIVSSKKTKGILEIPSLPKLVWEIAPELGKLAHKNYLIQDDSPNLISAESLDRWQDSDITCILEKFLAYEKIFTESDVINFLIDLVKLPSKSKRLSDRLQKTWKQVLQKAFQKTGIPTEAMGDSVRKAIALLDECNWFELKCCDSQLFQDLSRVHLDILLIPQKFAPSSKSSPKISGHDAGLLIHRLIDYRKRNPQENKQLIEQVIKAIPSSESEIATFRQSVNNLKLVPGFNCRSNCDCFYSYPQIEGLQKQGLLFKHSSKSREFFTDIQSALKEQTLVLVEGVIANKLLQQEVMDCDRLACLSVLQQKPELSEVENRTNLLKRLLS